MIFQGLHKIWTRLPARAGLIYGFWGVVLVLSIWIPFATRGIEVIPTDTSEKIYKLNAFDLVVTEAKEGDIYTVTAAEASYRPFSDRLLFNDVVISVTPERPEDRFSASAAEGIASVTAAGLLPKKFEQIEMRGRVTIRGVAGIFPPENGDTVMHAERAIWDAERRRLIVPDGFKAFCQEDYVIIPEMGYIDLRQGSRGQSFETGPPPPP